MSLDPDPPATPSLPPSPRAATLHGGEPRLELGDVLRTTLRVTLDRAGPIGLVTAAVIVPFVFIDLLTLNTNPPAGINIAATIANCWYIAVVTHITRDALDRTETPLSVTAQTALKTIGAVWWVGLLQGLLILVGLLALVVPGLIVWTATFLAVPVRLFEGVNGGAALRRSAEITRGNRLPVLGVGAIYVAMLVALLACAFGPLGLVEVWEWLNDAQWEGYDALAADWGSTEVVAAGVVLASVIQAVAQTFSTVAATVIYARLVPGSLKLDADEIADVFT